MKEADEAHIFFKISLWRGIFLHNYYTRNYISNVYKTPQILFFLIAPLKFYLYLWSCSAAGSPSSVYENTNPSARGTFRESRQTCRTSSSPTGSMLACWRHHSSVHLKNKKKTCQSLKAVCQSVSELWCLNKGDFDGSGGVLVK